MAFSHSECNIVKVKAETKAIRKQWVFMKKLESFFFYLNINYINLIVSVLNTFFVSSMLKMI